MTRLQGDTARRDVLGGSGVAHGWQCAVFSSTDEVIQVVENVVAAMTRAGYSGKDVFAVRLALEEALVNAVKHGHHYDPAKQVHVSYDVGPERVLVDIEDEGPGFDPGQVADPTAAENLERPCGRGLLLMRSFLTWVSYNERGNRVTLCKERTL